MSNVATGFGEEENHPAGALSSARKHGGRARVFWHPPASGFVNIVVLSRTPEQFWGHYVGNKMVECPGHLTCKNCHALIGKQKRYLLSVKVAPDGRPQVWEFGPYVGEQISDAVQDAGRLRGCFLTVSRLGNSDRCRIGVQGGYDLVEDDALPEPVNCLEEVRRNEPA